jgi:hypothetical protein
MCVLSYERRLTRTQLLSLGSLGDESWIYGYDPETKQQSSQGHNHQQQKRCGRSGVQQRACSLFFWSEGIVHQEFVPPNTTVNSDFYCEVLRRLKGNVRRKNRNFGATTTGSFITTTCLPRRPWKQSLWLTTTWLSFPILPTRRT